MPYCWKCEAPYTGLKRTPDFGDVCENCQSYWHACCNCRFYTGYPTGRCTLPNVEPVRDPEGMNYCGEFRLADQPPGKRAGEAPEQARRKWDELFSD